MASQTDGASKAWLEALIPIVAWFMLKEPEDYAYSVRNTEDCWYPPTCTIMTDLIPKISKSDETYNRTTAIDDAQGAINTLFTEFKDDVLVQVYQPMCIANGYNATTSQLLVDNAYAKAVNEGAKLQLDNVARYAGIRVNDLNVVAQLIQAIKNSHGVGNISESHNIETTNALNGMAKLGTSIFSDNVRDASKPSI